MSTTPRRPWRNFVACDPSEVKTPPPGTAYLFISNIDWCVWEKRADDSIWLIGPKPVPTTAEIRAALGVPNYLEKSVDEQRSGTTYASDASLTFAVAANKKYRFRVVAFFDSPTLAGFKFQLAGPASPTLFRAYREVVSPGAVALSAVAVDLALNVGVPLTNLLSATGGRVTYEGVIHTGAAGGTLAFQWAQNANNATKSTVRAGSHLEWKEL